MKGKHHSQETKNKISQSKKGTVSPFKGVHGRYTKETLKKMSDNNWMRGRKPTKKWLEKMRKINTGKKYMLGRHPSQETRKKQSITMTGRKNPYRMTALKIASIKKSLGNRGMSGLEKHIEKIINKYNLPYKYVGDGKLRIERKIPDFVNINGEKKVIEVYWKKHKDKFRGGAEKWKTEREKLFKSYGWTTIFIEGQNINENKVLSLIERRGD